MVIILIISIVLNFVFGWIGFDFYKKYVNVIKTYDYPDYYKSVLIYYQLPGEERERIEEAWLTVNDSGNYIWTLNDDETVISDDLVTKWEYINEER